MENIRTGDIIFTTKNKFVNVMVSLFTQSKANHVAIALWISEKGYERREMDIVPNSDNNAKLFFLELSKTLTFDFNTQKRKSGVVVVDFKDAKTRLDRFFSRPLSKSISDEEIVSRIKKFIENTKDEKYSLTFTQSLNIILEWNKNLKYKDEMCVSYVLKWLEMNGYIDDGKKSPQLQSPEYLTHDKNSSFLFEGKEVLIYDNPSFLNAFIVTMTVFLILIIACVAIVFLICSFNNWEMRFQPLSS